MTGRWGIILAMIAIIVVAVVALFVFFDKPANAPSDSLGENDLRELSSLQARSLALLENQLPRDAIPALESLKEKFPDESEFADYNLCLAHVYALELENASANNEEFAAEIQAAEQHFEQARQQLEQNVGFLVLESRLAAIQNLSERRAELLKTATELSPDSARVWFEQFQALKDVGGEEANAKELELVIKSCLQLAPENVWVNLQVLTTSTEDDEDIVLLALNNLAKAITPFADGVEARSRVNPVDFIKRAKDQVSARDFKGAERTIRILNNVLLPEDIAQSDRRVVEPNTLELMQSTLSERQQQAINELRINIPPPIDVRFENSLINTENDFSEILQCDVADIDLDGKYEILVLEPQRLSILDQQGGTSKWRVTHQQKLNQQAKAFVLVDLDQDADVNRPATIEGAPCALADLDVVILHDAGMSVFENRLGDMSAKQQQNGGDAALAVVDAATFPSLEGQPQICLPVDFDLDGDLDLCLVDNNGAMRFWANTSPFKFADASERSRRPKPGMTWTKAIAVDIDRDVDIDIVLAGEEGVGYMENLRHGSMRWRTIAADSDATRNLTDVHVVDMNHDASWDLLLCDGEAPLVLTSVLSDTGTTRWDTPTRLDVGSAHRMQLFDFDNDGFEDVVLYDDSNNECRLVRRSGPRDFTATGLGEGVKSTVTQSPGVTEDIDGDGDLDWLHWDQSQIAIVTNEGGNKNEFLKISLVGAQVKGGEASASGRVNHYGWGSICELSSAGNYQAKIVNRQTTHFGLGASSKADIVRILWPNGIPHNIIHPEENSFICENQRLKGSCPYLYVWDGKKFRFYTDLLWASPIGLQFADGVIAPTRPWEYLLVSGDAMKPKSNAYEIKVTEELWEAAYFDQIEIIAVDHPADVDIYSNEKVASSETPDFKIHTVQDPRQPEIAVDKHGRNVLPIIAEKDGDFAKLFDTKFYQGVTDEHFLELDLGDVPNDNIKLFLTGWVYPTDTSLNVALGQSAQTPKPRPPYLQTLNEAGEWQTVDPSMGFPGGKTKTIVVDLANKFLTPSRKLRIVTSMEIYWDHVFFSAGEDSAETKLQTLNIIDANLQHRGYSNVRYHKANGPESYDYYDLVDKFDWPPMKGAFTKYGDVTSLIQTADDEMIVMAAGDQMTIRFAVPAAPVPDGWKRDFIMHNVGYDKDADLHTVYGQTTGPYPTRSNATYPANRDETRKTMDSRSAGRLQPARRFWNDIRDFQPSEQ